MHFTKHPIFQSLLTTLTILGLSLAAAVPIIRGLPCSDDVAFHLLRLTELDFILRSGTFYSRWAPNMAQGHGFPLFNFYAPLSYYAAELISLIVGNLNLTLRWTFFLGVFLSGATMYRFSRDHFSQHASFVAAAAYMYAPYHGYDIYFRGNLAESFAWWLLPLALWSIGRLVRTPRPRYFLATTLTTAAILLTHNAFALVFCPIIAAYALFLWLTSDSNVTGRLRDRLSGIIKSRDSIFTFSLLSFALILALTLTTFFWLPALIERNLVHSDRLLIPPIFVYWGNFVTLGELLSPPRLIYTDLLNPSPPRALGLAQLIIALPALFLLYKRPATQNGATPSSFRLHPSAFFLIIALLYTFLMLEPSRIIWEVVPLLEFVQFPWRLLGCVAVALAFLTAAGIDTLGRWLPKTPTTILALALLIVSNLFWFAPRYCQGLENPTVADMLAFERDTQTIGTTAKGEYIPLTADLVPPYSDTFFEPNEQLTIHLNQRTPKQLSAQLTAVAPTTLIANTFYYPGWVATLNGDPAPLSPRETDGLIALDLPRGDHDITLTFTETPLRRTANLISAVSLLILFIVPVVMTGRPATIIPKNDTAQSLHFLQTPAAVSLLAFVVLITFWWHPLKTSYLPADTTAVYQNGVALLDYTISARSTATDEPVLVTTRFKAERQLTENVVTLLQLVDEDGRIWSGKESAAPRHHRAFYDSTTWPLHEYAEDMRLATVFPATPPGLYTIQLILFDRETLARFPLSDGRTELDLGTVQLERPTSPPEITPQHPSTADLGGITLVGYGLDRTEANVGDPFTANFYWHTSDTILQDYTLRLTLDSPDSLLSVAYDLPPVRNSFPTSQWQDGDLWRGQHTFRLPAGLETADYQWEACLTSPRNGQCLTPPIPLGTLAVAAPDRLFEVPEVDIDIDASLGMLTDLHGVILADSTLEPAGSLDLSLVWHVSALTSVPYRVFVQLLDPDGRPIAVSDGEPVGWTRPTTSWLPNEYLTDPHTLQLPDTLSSGTYTLITGMYNPATGQRLTTTQEIDHLQLTQFTIK